MDSHYETRLRVRQINAGFLRVSGVFFVAISLQRIQQNTDAVIRTYGGTRLCGPVIQPDKPRFDILYDLCSAPAYKLPGKQLIHAIANVSVFDEDLHFLDPARLTVYDVDGLWTRRLDG